MAGAEGLQAHKNAVAIRVKDLNNWYEYRYSC
jgi:histidinol dehydrogenase